MQIIGKLPIKKVLTREAETSIINLGLDSLYWITPILNEYLGQVEPPAELRLDGMLAYADGTNWNPGSGKGLYRYNESTSAWVLVG